MCAWSPRPKFLLLIALSSLPGLLPAQQCKNSIDATSATENFIRQQAKVVDNRTGLQWQACALGQHWSGNQCRGQAQLMNWQQASALEQQGWRLPTLRELARLTELSCQQPAINLAVFPDTPPKDFWTSTEFASNPDNAWLVNFHFGESHTDNKQRKAYVRLVKNVRNRLE